MSEGKKTTKSNKNKNEPDQDGFFGDPKLRGIVIAGLLIAMSILQMPAVSEYLDTFKDAKEICKTAASLYGASMSQYADVLGQYGIDTGDTYAGSSGSGYGGAVATDYASICDSFDQFIAGLTIHLIGLVFIMVFGIVSIVIHFLNWADCSDKVSIAALVIMIGLMIGGFFHILGHLIWRVEPSGSSSDVANFMATCYFAENLLGGVTAIVYGYDVWKKNLNDGKTRMLFQSFVLLTVVSLLCFLGYAYIGSELEHEETQVIAAGYFFILLSSVLYLVFGLKEMGLNPIKNMLLVIIVGIVLIIGSVLCAIGYWGGYTCDSSISACSDLNAYITGYTVILIGLCVVNALDRGMYDDAKKFKTVSQAT